MGVEPRDALRDAVAAVESAGPGASHSELASQTQRVAWLVARGELDEREVLEAFRAAGDRRGKPTSEVEAAWASAMKKAAPASSPAPASKAAAPKKSKAPRKVFADLDDATQRVSFVMNKPKRGAWVYRSAAGAEVMTVVRFGDGEDKECRPFHERAEGGWVMADPAGKLPLYRLPELARDPDGLVVVCEGEKATDLAAGLGFTATTSSHGSGSPQRTDWGPLAGRRVAILPDADDEGAKYAASVAGFLAKLKPPAEVRIVRLPGLPPKGDVEQFIQAGGTAEKLWELIEAAPTESVDDGPPVVVVTTDIEAVDDAVLEALKRDPKLYRSGFALVTILDSGEPARGVEYKGPPPPQVRPIPPPILRERIATWTRLVKVKRRGDVEDLAPTLPPDWCVSALHARGVYPGFRVLDGVILAPTIRPDGSILDQPGYDAATRLFYRPTIEFGKIPASPTRAQAEAAMAMVADLVCDFPFRSEVDRAVWVAALVTVLAKSSFFGPVPLFGFDGNCPGAGKTMLADLISILAIGIPAPAMSFPTGKHGNEEMDKRILSLAMAGDRLTLLDNVDEPLGGEALNAAITKCSWKGRALGRSEIVSMDLHTTWFASGNNLSVKGDMLRRVLFARIETTSPNPEERSGFKYPDLIAHVMENRGTLVAAALTILRAWYVAGRPSVVAPLGSFEGWSRAVADPVAWIMGVDPTGVRKYTKEEDRDSAARLALVAGWAQLPNSERGLTVADAYRLLKAHGHEDRFAGLRAALADLSDDGELPKPKSLAGHLRNIKGRPVGTMRIMSAVDSTSNATAWRIEKIPDSPDSRIRCRNDECANGLGQITGFAGFDTPLRAETAQALVDAQFSPSTRPGGESGESGVAPQPIDLDGFREPDLNCVHPGREVFEL